jgi:Cornichon protein
MVFVWLLCFFLLIGIISLVIFQVFQLELHCVISYFLFCPSESLRIIMLCLSAVFTIFGFFFGQVMCLADLEFDYINPYDTASRVNKVMVPEFILQGILSLVLLITGHWIMFLLSLPFVYYDYTL